MLPSTRGPKFTNCKVCKTDINISHGGLSDVKKHLATSKHKEIVKAASSSGNVRAFLQQPPLGEKITRAEILFANFVAEHNLPFLTANHFIHLTSVMFPDSDIAQPFSSARTKITCIVKGALHPHFAKPVIAVQEVSFFNFV